MTDTTAHHNDQAHLTLWRDCNLSTMQLLQASNQSQQLPNLELIPQGAILIEGELIKWVGPINEIPQHLSSRITETYSAQGRLVTPGLIDCHTHLVYAGDRANEFEMRLNGASYEEISRAGGGINSTVNATRQASAEQLHEQSLLRLKALMAEGVTTIEIKSGYGLNLDTERRCLEVARHLARSQPISIQNTFLGAHAVPQEYAGKSEAYVDTVLEMMTTLNGEGLIDAADVFCERIGFSLVQTQRIFEHAKSLSIPVKIHAEQLSDSGGTQLASMYCALSCDHLEWLSEQGAQSMAQSGSVAVLLPGAYYFLRETKLPPISLLRTYGIPIAVSTDSNPGSSPCTSLLLMLNMACTLFKLTPQEALLGVTRYAAKALGLQDRGVLEQGKRADFVLWNVSNPTQLCYNFGRNPRFQTIRSGKIITLNEE